MAACVVVRISRLSAEHRCSTPVGWMNTQSRNLLQYIRRVQSTSATKERPVVATEQDSFSSNKEELGRDLGDFTTLRVQKQCEASSTVLTPARRSSGKTSHLDFKKENIWTIPNLLCLFRIAASPYLAHLVLSGKYSWAFCLLGFAAATDLLDGQIARRYPSQSSRIGSVLDPLADKCLIAVLSVSLTAVGIIPLPLTALFISRDVCLIGGAFYIRYKTIPKPRTWSNFWNVQRSAVQVTPSTVSKLNTTLQLVLVGLSVGAPVFNYVDHPLIQGLWYITALTTVSSGLSYIFQMKGFRVLQKTQTHNPFRDRNK